ncbi:hypothetical protein Vretimale_18123, partial [Volvox reticuliferus]
FNCEQKNILNCKHLIALEYLLWLLTFLFCCFFLPHLFNLDPDILLPPHPHDAVPPYQIAIECCPVDCIHWVSLPQLSLLEAALSRMGRIEVSVMQRFGRSGGNVFQVAYKAWEQRMAAIQERAAAASAAAAAADGRGRVDWSFWVNGASLQYDEEA